MTANTSNGSAARHLECEECGDSGAQRINVKFEDGNSDTLALCDSCLNTFRSSELIDKTSILDSDTVEFPK